MSPVHSAVKSAEATGEKAVENLDGPGSQASVNRFESAVVLAERLYWFLKEVCACA